MFIFVTKGFLVTWCNKCSCSKNEKSSSNFEDELLLLLECFLGYLISLFYQFIFLIILSSSFAALSSSAYFSIDPQCLQFYAFGLKADHILMFSHIILHLFLENSHYVELDHYLHFLITYHCTHKYSPFHALGNQLNYSLIFFQHFVLEFVTKLSITPLKLFELIDNSSVTVSSNVSLSLSEEWT
ncbi:hypothetical protein AGLY_015764 [Aphis glycines]|uniref:Uncharacterized protein n=1 Tax=Aphis glycines TaxID=307491 RepID=A0A6G0SZR4_APHGL|nr:hypothetical protein AGLY_015764 [Aphis glycines]